MTSSELHFIRDGVHTFLVLPASTLINKLPQLEQYLAPDSLAEVGWGDYHYYGADYQSLWLALKALLTPTASVVSLRSLNNLQEGLQGSATLYRINTGQALMDSTAHYVSRYFSVNSCGQLNMLRQMTGGTQFFESRGTYLLFNTCNNWTSYGLQQAGLNMRPRLNLLAGQVERSLRRNGYLPIKC